MVRKNALIILTQLLLQDFLKWKGFLLYRFLLLCIDADFEIAQFARNLLQKTLNAKFPQLLTNHFSEAVVILNGCIHHQIYHSVVRTNLNVINGIDCQSSIDPKQSDDGGQGCFSIRLSSTQRFEIYAFMAESLDDESRIQVSAKLVQDVLSHAVDHPSMLKMDSHPSMLKMGSDSKSKRSGSGLNPSEAAIDDVFQLLKSPFLKVRYLPWDEEVDDHRW
jgi:condensin-2 complex subunit D3